MKQRQRVQTRQAIVAVLISIVGGLLLIALAKKNPFTTFGALLVGGLRNLSTIGGTLGIMGTLLLASLSVSFAYRGGLYNLGVSGQMLAGGFITVLLLNVLPLPRALLLPIALLGGVLAGALWAAIPALLRALFSVHEALSTIFMNLIAYNLILLFPPESPLLILPLSRSLRLPFGGAIPLHYGVLLAALATVGTHLLLEKSVLGFEIKAAGANRRCASYAGINPLGSVVVTLVVAGALAALAGASYFGGDLLALPTEKLPFHGYDAIAIALVGSVHPIGVLIGSLYIALLRAGAPFMHLKSGLPLTLVDSIVSIIVYSTGISALILHLWRQRKKQQQREADPCGK